MNNCLRSFIAALILAGALAAQPAPDPDPEPQQAEPQVRERAREHKRSGFFRFHKARPGASYLGVMIIEMTGERAGELGMEMAYGVEVTNVAEDSPAAEAGIRKGDVILEYFGQRVLGIQNFIRLVGETPVGRTVPVKLLRGGEEIELHATIGRRKGARPAHAFSWCEGAECGPHKFPGKITIDIPRPRFVFQSGVLGAELEPVEGQFARYFGVSEGLLVRRVDPNSPAARAELQAGDVIVSAAGRKVRELHDLRGAIRSTPPDEKVELKVYREKSERTLTLEPRGRGDRRLGPAGAGEDGGQGERP